jgi:hypothetical protein
MMPDKVLVLFKIRALVQVPDLQHPYVFPGPVALFFHKHALTWASIPAVCLLVAPEVPLVIAEKADTVLHHS